MFAFSSEAIGLCELMGYGFNRSVSGVDIFSAFRRRAVENADGWGLAFFDDNGCLSFQIKEARSALKSSLARKICESRRLRSRVLLSHVRRSTVGKVNFQNTHPFIRETDGKVVTFCHNGTLKKFRNKLPVGQYFPEGETDSEYLFCHLLHRLDFEKSDKWDRDDFELIRQILQRANDFGKMNVMFSDGWRLFVYYDKNSFKDLRYIRVEKREELFNYEGLFATELESEVPPPPQPLRGVFFATRALSATGWVGMEPGRLVVVADGVPVVY